jgi:carboxymethylenebutenolidase
VILPDVRGLHPFYEELALRFAERGIDALAIDYFGRDGGRRGAATPSSTCRTPSERPGPASRATSPPASMTLRREGIDAVFTIGFCMGGRMSFLASTLGPHLAGVIGMYGTLQGPWRNDAPAPLDRIDDVAAPVLGLFGGADEGITPRERSRAFDRGLEERASITGSSPIRARRTASSTGRPSITQRRARRPGRGHRLHRSTPGRDR